MKEHYVYLKGGSIGNNSKLNSKGHHVVKEFETIEEAKIYGKRMNKLLTAGEKGYYRMKYIAV